MAEIMKETKAVQKSNTANMGNSGNYKFRGIDDMYNALHDAFAKQNVFIIPEILEEKSEIIEKEKTYNGQKNITYSKYTTLEVKYTFYAEDGSSVSAIGIGEAIDTSDKGTNKAQSSALKYVLMQTFLIPTEEEKDVETKDNKIEAPKKIMEFNALNTVWLSDEQFQKLKDMIDSGENLNGVKATFNKYSGTIVDGVKYAMKKEFKTTLANNLKI